MVFLGPSLSRADARERLDADYRPPARAGDVWQAVEDGAQVIGVVDGYFDQVPSVGHKEVLYALSRGVHVFGASSMGALRAAELHTFGMVGVGRTFEWYRDGVLEDDDEVAVVHAPAEHGWRPHSEAMVNLRDGLDRAVAVGVFAAPIAAALVAAAKARFYPERSWPRTLEDADALGVPTRDREALTTFLRDTRPNLKRDDALLLLDRLAAGPPAGPAVLPFGFHASAFWQDYVAQRGREGPASDALAVRIRVATGGRDPALRDALVLYLLAEASERLDLSVDDARVDLARDAAREATPGADDEDLESLAAAEIITGELLRARQPEVDACLRLALLRRGELTAVLDELAAEDATLAARGLDDLSRATVGLDLAALFTEWRDEVGLAEETPEAAAARLGLPSPRALLDEIVRRHHARRLR